jgi:hypothetical protein
MGGICAAAWAPNRLDIFSIGTGDQALYHKAWDGHAWWPTISGWESLGGKFNAFRPCVVAWGPNRLDVFAMGDTPFELYHKAWDGQKWSPSQTAWENLGGTICSGPCVAAWGPNRLDVFAVGGTAPGPLFHLSWDGLGWTPWEDLGGQFLNNTPCVTSWGSNRLDVFGVGADLGIYHKAWNGSSWLPGVNNWESLGKPGGGCVTAPCVASWGPNRLDVFAVGKSDQALYHTSWNGQAWTPWQNLGGQCVGDPAVASWGPNRLDVFVVGAGDHALYHKQWDGQQWLPSITDWQNLGGVCRPGPAVVSWQAKRLEVMVMG